VLRERRSGLWSAWRVAGLEELSRAELIELASGQARRIGELEAENAELGKRLERLERLVSRNSGNSSMPPSSDEAPGKTPPRRERRAAQRAGRKRGKQGGAEGHALAWAPDPLVVDHRPAGRCPGCGHGLENAAGGGLARAVQVTDIPPVTATVTEHRMHRVCCGCGLTSTAAAPPEAAAGASRVYGPNLRALVVYLLAYQQLPIERAARLIADVTGAAPSVGFTHGMLARFAAAVVDVVAVIKTLITAAHVAHFDETTLRSGPAGTRRYVLSAGTSDYTAFHLGGRDLASFTSFGVLPGFAGIAVHDRYSAYDHAGFAVGAHQLCVAHLLRDLEDAAQTYPGAHWPDQAARALRALVHAHHQARDTGTLAVPVSASEQHIREFRAAVRVGLAQLPRPAPGRAGPPARRLLEDLRDREADVLRFVGDTRVEPTNNLAERDLRWAKTQQNTSGRLTDPEVTVDRLTARSYIATVAKHGHDILAAIRDALTGNPWTPPAAARTTVAGA
jgi:transposase